MLTTLQEEVEAAKVALEQAEMAAVVAATECINMQKVGLHKQHTSSRPLLPVRCLRCLHTTAHRTGEIQLMHDLYRTVIYTGQ